MNFDLKYHIENKSVFHCNTEILANSLLRVLIDYEYYWYNGDLLNKYNKWKRYKQNTCYYLISDKSAKKILFSDIENKKIKKLNVVDYRILRIKQLSSEFLNV
jgi:hypothetical protein